MKCIVFFLCCLVFNASAHIKISVRGLPFVGHSHSGTWASSGSATNGGFSGFSQGTGSFAGPQGVGFYQTGSGVPGFQGTSTFTGTSQGFGGGGPFQGTGFGAGAFGGQAFGGSNFPLNPFQLFPGNKPFPGTPDGPFYGGGGGHSHGHGPGSHEVDTDNKKPWVSGGETSPGLENEKPASGHEHGEDCNHEHHHQPENPAFGGFPFKPFGPGFNQPPFGFPATPQGPGQAEVKPGVTGGGFTYFGNIKPGQGGPDSKPGEGGFVYFGNVGHGHEGGKPGTGGFTYFGNIGPGQEGAKPNSGGGFTYFGTSYNSHGTWGGDQQGPHQHGEKPHEHGEKPLQPGKPDEHGAHEGAEHVDSKGKPPTEQHENSGKPLTGNEGEIVEELPGKIDKINKPTDQDLTPEDYDRLNKPPSESQGEHEGTGVEPDVPSSTQVPTLFPGHNPDAEPVPTTTRPSRPSSEESEFTQETTTPASYQVTEPGEEQGSIAFQESTDGPDMPLDLDVRGGGGLSSSVRKQRHARRRRRSNLPHGSNLN